MATLAEYYAGLGGAEDLDWTQRREIAQAGGQLRYDNPAEMPDDRYLRQITDYWGGSASVPTARGGRAVLDNQQVGAGGYRTVRNPNVEAAANLQKAYAMNDYISQFADPATAREQVRQLTGIDLGTISAPNQRKKAGELMNLQRTEAQILDEQAQTAQRYGDIRRKKLSDVNAAETVEDLIALGFSPEVAEARMARIDEARRQAAIEAGVPTGPAMPKGLSKGARERMLAVEAKAAEKTVSEQAEKAMAADAMLRQGQDFMTYAERAGTGGVFNAKPIAAVKGMFGGDVGTMQSITAKLVPQARQGFPGAASELDREMFREAVPSVDKPMATNRNIVNGMQQAAAVEKERLAFLDAYRAGNNGRLAGAEGAWQEYLRDNPIYDQRQRLLAPEDRTYELNSKRMGWQQYFKMREEAKQELARRQRGR